MIKFNLNVLNTDYNIFKSDSNIALITRAKNLLTALKNTNGNNNQLNRIITHDAINDDSMFLKRLLKDIFENNSAKSVL